MLNKILYRVKRDAHFFIGCMVLLGGSAVAAEMPIDASWHQQFNEHYNQYGDSDADMLALEMKNLVGLVASRGSAANSASNKQRIAGFQSALLQSMQGTYCNKKQSPTQRPWPGLTEMVFRAAQSQRLLIRSDDSAELTAITQRWLDQNANKKWCRMTSIGE